MSILSGLTRADIREVPFPHTVRENVFGWQLYNDLRELRPTWASDIGENQRQDIPAHQALAIGSKTHHLWQTIIAMHVCRDFWKEIVTLYGDHIRELYPFLEQRIGPLESAKTCVRGKNPRNHDPIMLDCQIGINTPSKTTSRVRGPHVDNPCELFAAMLYMKEPDDNAGGDLVLYKPKGDVKFHGKAEVDDALVEPVATVPYAANTVVTFLNSPNAIHGVTPRLASDKPRLLVNIIAEVRFPLFDLAR